jgi:hypothetical protein
MTTTFRFGDHCHFERRKPGSPQGLMGKSMTRKEFEKLRLAIEGEKFQENFSDPLSYGLQRAAFERGKFQRLITAAQGINLQTTRAKMEQWKRQLERATQSQQRFQRLRDEVSGNRRAAA